MVLLVLLAVGQEAAADVVCHLKMEGFGTHQGLKKAHVSCTGGSIRAVAHPLLAPLVGATAGVQSGGVQWLERCGPVWTTECLLTVCDGSNATFLSARVTKVNVTAMGKLGTHMLVCTSGNSSITFEGAVLERNAGRAMTGGGTLNIKSSTFVNNVWSGDGLEGGAMYIDTGTTVLQSCKFIGNAIIGNEESRGGAVAVAKGARVNITLSTFQDNKGRCQCGTGRVCDQPLHVAHADLASST
jgi:hypothetical protein